MGGKKDTEGKMTVAWPEISFELREGGLPLRAGGNGFYAWERLSGPMQYTRLTLAKLLMITLDYACTSSSGASVPQDTPRQSEGSENETADAGPRSLNASTGLSAAAEGALPEEVMLALYPVERRDKACRLYGPQGWRGRLQGVKHACK